MDRAILGRHVTNIDGNVYCLTNLRKKLWRLIFAYVSRSDRSFRENLLRLIKQGDLGEPFDEQTPPTFALSCSESERFSFTMGYLLRAFSYR